MAFSPVIKLGKSSEKEILNIIEQLQTQWSIIRMLTVVSLNRSRSKLRCAVYVRVSTDHDEQKTSLENQKQLFYNFIAE